VRIKNGSVVGLRLGGRQYAQGAYLEDGTPIAVIEWSRSKGRDFDGVDHEGYEVKFVDLFGAAVHPWEITGIPYTAAHYQRLGKADPATLTAQELEFIGLDPTIRVPTDSYFVFGSGSHEVYVKGRLPEKEVIDFGHNGFWGENGIECKLSEIPATTKVYTVSNPGGTHIIVGRAD
jgi:hypothetical protein